MVKRRLLLVFLISLLVSGLFLTALDGQVRPIAEKLALAELDNEVTGEVNSLCRQLTEDGTLSYQELVSVNYDQSGNVIGMTTNMDTINVLRMEIGKGVSEVLAGKSRRRVKIPVGAVLKWNLFSFLGPELSVQLLHVGQVSISFDHQFRTVSLGQTSHTVNMIVTVEVLLMLPGGISEQTLSCTVPLAESLLIGEIPQSYHYFGRATDSTALQNETY